MKEVQGKELDLLLETAAEEFGVNVVDLGYIIKEKDEADNLTVEIYSYKDVQEFIYDYLETYFKNLELEVEIEISYDGKMYQVFLNAENNAIVIGKAGQTLQALNNLLRVVVNARFKRRFFITLDINNYKADRYEKIKSIAYRVAREVVESKISATLDPMPNDERRVIHNYLTNMENIRTASIGEGRERRLVIHYTELKEDTE